MTDFLAGLRTNQAATDLHAADQRLRGRTYAIPFEDVWNAAVVLAGGGLRGWSLISADDQRGLIEAHVRGGPLRPEMDVRIRIRLDRNGQTRADLRVASRSERGDLGRSRRSVARFTARLDRKLHARPEQILDPTTMAAYARSEGSG